MIHFLCIQYHIVNIFLRNNQDIFNDKNKNTNNTHQIQSNSHHRTIHFLLHNHPHIMNYKHHLSIPIHCFNNLNRFYHYKYCILMDIKVGIYNNHHMVNNYHHHILLLYLKQYHHRINLCINLKNID